MLESPDFVRGIISKGEWRLAVQAEVHSGGRAGK